jgi:hypothetical protein
LPSSPGCTTSCTRGDSPAAVCAIRSGSSPDPTTVSLPGGSRIDPVRWLTTRFDPAGATLPTISITLKN